MNPNLFTFDPHQGPAIVIDPRTWPPTREGVHLFVSALKQFIEARMRGALDPVAPLFRVERPCGRVYEFRTADDFPLFDLPCGCGDPDCVVVQWGEPGA